LKDSKSSPHGKGLYEALYWLKQFISHFEHDHALFLEDYKDLMETPEDKLSEEDLVLKKQ
jgi:hypothetical protein